ncbi:MAG: hypothetical protein RQ745_13620, partial [Longimicrobiales bacterium]|nr:hypothetical protein [Longimicrobiales bacterium]
AGGRGVLITPVERVEAIEEVMGHLRGRLQVVGVGGLDAESEARVAGWAAAAGASRVAPLKAVAYPPPWWIHDGRGPLDALVDRVEWVE